MSLSNASLAFPLLSSSSIETETFNKPSSVDHSLPQAALEMVHSILSSSSTSGPKEHFRMGLEKIIVDKHKEPRCDPLTSEDGYRGRSNSRSEERKEQPSHSRAENSQSHLSPADSSPIVSAIHSYLAQQKYEQARELAKRNFSLASESGGDIPTQAYAAKLLIQCHLELKEYDPIIQLGLRFAGDVGVDEISLRFWIGLAVAQAYDFKNKHKELIEIGKQLAKLPHLRGEEVIECALLIAKGHLHLGTSDEAVQWIVKRADAQRCLSTKWALIDVALKTLESSLKRGNSTDKNVEQLIKEQKISNEQKAQIAYRLSCAYLNEEEYQQVQWVVREFQQLPGISSELYKNLQQVALEAEDQQKVEFKTLMGLLVACEKRQKELRELRSTAHDQRTSEEEIELEIEKIEIFNTLGQFELAEQLVKEVRKLSDLSTSLDLRLMKEEAVISLGKGKYEEALRIAMEAYNKGSLDLQTGEELDAIAEAAQEQLMATLQETDRQIHCSLSLSEKTAATSKSSK